MTKHIIPPTTTIELKELCGGQRPTFPMVRLHGSILLSSNNKR